MKKKSVRKLIQITNREEKTFYEYKDGSVGRLDYDDDYPYITKIEGGYDFNFFLRSEIYSNSSFHYVSLSLGSYAIGNENYNLQFEFHYEYRDEFENIYTYLFNIQKNPISKRKILSFLRTISKNVKIESWKGNDGIKHSSIELDDMNSDSIHKIMDYIDSLGYLEVKAKVDFNNYKAVAINDGEHWIFE